MQSTVKPIATQALTSLKRNGVQVLVVLLFVSFKLLFDQNLGGDGWNEVDVLPLAKQFVDPDWVPKDWYLDQPPGYRFLFQALFGQMIMAWGFLATSLVGRLICYSLFSWGVVLLGRRLGLSLLPLLLALGLFLYTGGINLQGFLGYEQGVIAGEWMVGGLEAKSLAYPLVLLAISWMLAGRYRGMALLLGLATSFHVLVGGWAFLAVLGWLLLHRSQVQKSWGSIALLYLAGSVFAIQPILAYLWGPTVSGVVQPTFVYVFMRLPHHLNPLAWPVEGWIKPIGFLGVLTLSVWVLRWRQAKRQADLPLTDSLSTGPLPAEASAHAARMGLAQFTLVTLIPFVIGVAIAPFDRQGQLLQYYPFRLGDVMLSFNTSLLLACAMEQTLVGKVRRLLLVGILVFLGLACSIQANFLFYELADLQQTTGDGGDADSRWGEFCQWIRSNTPENAIVVSPPVKFPTFTRLTERATIAKYKLFPQTKTGMVGWYERLNDLSGGTFAEVKIKRAADDREAIREALTTGYEQLTTPQAEALMAKYNASYFVTFAKHHLELPIAHRSGRFILYTKP
jgi:VanZ family protein